MKDFRYWLAGALIAVAILFVFASDLLAAESGPDVDGDGCTSYQEFIDFWNAGAAAEGVSLEINQHLTEDQIKLLLMKVQNIAGSPPPWDFNEVWAVRSSGGVMSVIFFKDGCAVGRLSASNDVWDVARSTESRTF